LPWLLVAYQAPASPSTARVLAWRGLHALGGIYLGPTVCLLPSQVADRSKLQAIGDRVTAAGGAFEIMTVEAFEPQAERRLQSRYNEARSAEYAEIAERAAAIVDELGRESARGKFTFAEVEENEAGVAKVRGWVRRVNARDLFGCDSRSEAELAIQRAEQTLAVFTEQAVARGSAVGGSADATSESGRRSWM
jgi:hypothetical protein